MVFASFVLLCHSPSLSIVPPFWREIGARGKGYTFGGESVFLDMTTGGIAGLTEMPGEKICAGRISAHECTDR